MLPISSVITVAEVEGVAAVSGPISLVVERRRIPDNLEHELGDLDGVGRRASGAGREEVGGAGGGIGNMILMVGAVEVDAVPASTDFVSDQIVGRGEWGRLTLGRGCWSECRRHMRPWGKTGCRALRRRRGQRCHLRSWGRCSNGSSSASSSLGRPVLEVGFQKACGSPTMMFSLMIIEVAFS